MKKITVLFLIVLAVACGEKKKILLPQAGSSVIKNVEDISTIDVFFTMKSNDTIAQVSKNTVISTTNWVFNIDKRLSLKMILPDIIKLQQKKRKKQEGAVATTANYYSYADSIGKNLAFLSFTNTIYKLKKPSNGIVVYFDKNNKVYVNDSLVEREKLQQYIVGMNQELNPVCYCFDKNMLYNDYIINRLFLNSIEHKMIGVAEYVY